MKVALAFLLPLAIDAFLAITGHAAPPENHKVRGTEALQAGDYETAISELESARKIDPDPALIYRLADAHRLHGEDACALQLYRTYLHLIPMSKKGKMADRRFERGINSLVTRNYSEAITELKAAFGLVPSPWTLIQLAEAYRLAGNAKLALSSYRLFTHPERWQPTKAAAELHINELLNAGGTTAAVQKGAEAETEFCRSSMGDGGSEKRE